jgi:hypothetical protein
MTGRERRLSPRKVCAVPLRFGSRANGNAAQVRDVPDDDEAQTQETKGSPHTAAFEGQVLNLSERGIYFLTTERLGVGEPLEMFFTLPRDLTGRGPEAVHCSVRVVHVEECSDQGGLMGIGAVVERFEPAIAPRDWSN